MSGLLKNQLREKELKYAETPVEEMEGSALDAHDHAERFQLSVPSPLQSQLENPLAAPARLPEICFHSGKSPLVQL